MDLKQIFEESQLAEEPKTADLTVASADFLAALRRIKPAISSRPMLPVLSCVLITGSKTGLELRTTNLDSHITDRIEGEFPDVEFLLPHSVALRFAVSAKGKTISFVFAEKAIKLFSGTAEITIAGIMNPGDFPDAPDFPEAESEEIIVTDPAMWLADLVQCAKYAAADDSRKMLTGVRMEEDDEKSALCLAATDGKRLLMCKSSDFAVNRIDHTQQAKDIVIPAAVIPKLAAFFRNSGDRLTVRLISGKRMGVSCEGRVFLFRLIDGQYPNYKQVIPQSYSKRILISGFALGWGINMLGVSRNKTDCKITIGKNALNLSYDNTDFNYTTGATIPAETLEVDGGELWMNGRFLAALAALGESIEVTWTESFNQVMFNAGRYSCIIMPIRRKY